MRWPTSVWRDLLRETCALIDTLSVTPAWTFGGGTSLSVHLGHRHSSGVDAFVDASQVIRELAPNRNPTTKALLKGRPYEYAGHCLKLHLEGGEIDFLVGTLLSETPTVEWEFEGRVLAIDMPWETAGKKLFYRPSTLKVRDIFDLAAVIEAFPNEFLAVLPEVEEKMPLAIDRVDAFLPAYEADAIKEINPTERGKHLMRRDAAETVLGFLRSWRAPDGRGARVPILWWRQPPNVRVGEPQPQRVREP
jgi:hypothetical protein